MYGSPFWFKILAVVHGGMVLGLTIFIFSYYFPKTKRQVYNILRWHIVTIALSYIMLTTATIVSILLDMYVWGGIWYNVVMLAYVIGDVSLFLVLKVTLKGHNMDKENNFIKHDNLKK